MGSKKDNTDFLQEFFKNNGIFAAPESQSTIPSEIKAEKEEPRQITQKDINLKALFENIEQEKQKHQKSIKKEISEKKYILQPEISIIKLQSEARHLFENFLKILPIVERQFHLDILQSKKERKTRGKQEYLPEIWEQKEKIIFFEESNPEADTIINKEEEEDVLDQIPREHPNEEEEEIHIQIEKTEEEILTLEKEEEELNDEEAKIEREKELYDSTQRDADKKAFEREKERQLREKQRLQKEKFLKIQLEEKKKLELEALKQKEEELKKENIRKRKEKFEAVKDHITRTGHQYLFTATKKMQKGILSKKDIFKAAKEKEEAKANEFSFTSLIPKFSPKKQSFKVKQKHEDRVYTAIQRAKKREINQQEKNKASEFIEILKIGAIVATLFFVSMVGLNYSAFLERYEKYWNASVFLERQDSIDSFISTTSEVKSSNNNDVSHIPLLPVAGTQTTTQENKGFNTKLYLNINPPDTRIVIPKIAKNIPIVEVSEDSRREENWNKLEDDIQDALQDGVVHYPGTAKPGQFGNTFITGHSSYYPWDEGNYKDVFAALHDLEEGDEYYIFHKGKKYKYKITTRKIVPPSDVSVLEQDVSKKTSTLMTCTPIGTAAKRLILQAEQISVE